MTWTPTYGHWRLTPTRDFHKGSQNALRVGQDSAKAFTASADGKRLVFQQVHVEKIVKIAEVRAGGSGLARARPLDADTWFSGAGGAWTPDSRKVLFTASAYGKRGIFQQDIDARSARPLVSGSSESYDSPVVSPDGKWLLYTEHREDGTSQLMRMPIDGGPAAFVLPGDHGYRCAFAPANLCVLSDSVVNKWSSMSWTLSRVAVGNWQGRT